MKRRLGLAVAAIGAWLLLVAAVVPATPALAAATAYSIKDTFSSGAYNGNDGSYDYGGPWWEENDWGGSNKGAVAVVNDHNCPNGKCARISGESQLWGTGLARRANTEDAASAVLHFKYRLVVNEPTDGRLDIAAFDGWNWTTLDSLSLSGDDDAVRNASYDVFAYADPFFSVGFFASGEWNGAVYIDDVKVSGLLVDTTTITTEPPTTSTTSEPPTTTTTSAPPTTTTHPPTSSTTSVVPPTTTAAPTTTTTSRPPSTTTQPATPATTTPPQTTATPTTTTTPTTTRTPTTEPPLENDARYKDKGALAFSVFDDDLTATAELATMPGEVALPEPSPVTQIMASITVSAVTIRSQLLSAIALGLLIAAAAVIGLGRREEPAATDH